MTGDDIADIATFLDTEHPDAVLLIARGAISMGADRAHLIKVASDHCQLRVRVDEEITDHRLDYRTGQATLDGIRTELFELMRRSRSQVSATFPITALERIVAHAERVDACSATVMSRQTVSPSLVEITFAGVGHIESIGGDEYVKVSTQSASAFLTVRRRRVVLGEVDMWFVLHSGGPMSRWARSASVGEQVIMTGPQRSFEPPPDATHIVALGDMAGLAAIARIIDEASPAMRITAVVAADAETLKRTLVPSDTTNIHATDPHSIDPLLVALRNDASIDIGPNTYVFGAGESLEMAAIRTHLRHDRNVATNRFSVNGYWRRDRGVHASGAVRLGPACMTERRHMSDAAWQRR